MVSMKDNKIVAIIPARGGSKGIPRKNLCLLAGKPLIAHIIECARRARTVSRVIVSTDDSEIVAVSKQYGAEVVRRPQEISSDTASSESALLHVLGHLEEKEGYRPDLTVFLQCTNPLILPEDIDGAVEMLVNDNADVAFSVTPIHCFLWRNTEDGRVEGINHDERRRIIRQNRESQYLETGAFYVMRTKGFLKAKYRFFGKIKMHVIPQERALEIDEPVDFKIAEVLFSQAKPKTPES